MKNLALLEYMFMLEPNSTWSHAYQFEQDLSDFFAAHGFEANVVNILNAGTGRRILLIKKLEAIIPTPKGAPGRPASTGTMLNKFRQGKDSARARDFKKGELVKTKGYLKRG